jgi:hypothetical protein
MELKLRNTKLLIKRLTGWIGVRLIVHSVSLIEMLSRFVTSKLAFGLRQVKLYQR